MKEDWFSGDVKEDTVFLRDVPKEEQRPLGWPAALVWVSFFLFLSVLVWVVFG